MVKNFFRNLPHVKNGEEAFEIFTESNSYVIERITSNNAVSPDESFYDQPHDEWVMVTQGSAVIQMNGENIELHPGDTLFIPACTKHKVVFTSANPVCVWLAVHEKK